MNAATSRILVVDEEAQIRKLLRTVLARAGYEVQTARTAEEAIGTWGPSMSFDAVISETNLSGMDGHEFARQMAVRCPGSRMIFVSASDTGCEACPHARQCPSIRKPFDPSEVVRTVSGILAARTRLPN